MLFLTQNSAYDKDVMPKLEKYVREGGIAIVRVSGPEARKVFLTAFQPARPDAPVRSHLSLIHI